MIVRTRRTIFALNRSSSVSKFEHGQAQAMGIGIAFSNPTGPLGATGPEPCGAAILPDLFSQGPARDQKRSNRR